MSLLQVTVVSRQLPSPHPPPVMEQEVAMEASNHQEDMEAVVGAARLMEMAVGVRAMVAAVEAMVEVSQVRKCIIIIIKNSLSVCLVLA